MKCEEKFEMSVTFLAATRPEGSLTRPRGKLRKKPRLTCPVIAEGDFSGFGTRVSQGNTIAKVQLGLRFTKLASAH